MSLNSNLYKLNALAFENDMMKTLLILGSNSDVGKACASRFASEDFHIILASRVQNEDQRTLANDLSQSFGVNTEWVYFDALQTDMHHAFYHSLSTKPEVVISAFGILGDHTLALDDYEEAARITATNYLGNLSALHIIAKDMEERKAGTIIGISSVAGERGRKNNYIYGASKAALTNFLSGLRARLATSNVHVITVIPGFISTKMIAGMSTPKLLTAQPDEVADCVWNAYIKRENVVFVKPIWKRIMWFIRSIPENVFKKMDL